MKLLKNIEIRNLLIDIVLILLAMQYLDISGIVRDTFPYVIYFLVLIQSFVFFLMYGNDPLKEEDAEKVKFSILENIRLKLVTILYFYIVFYFFFSWIWILLPTKYLDYLTNIDNEWIFSVSGIIGFICGVVVFARMFINSDSEKKEFTKVDKFISDPFKEKPIPIAIFGLVAVYIFYVKFGNQKIRDWLAYFIGFIYLVYTETLFEIMAGDIGFLADPKFSIKGFMFF